MGAGRPLWETDYLRDEVPLILSEISVGRREPRNHQEEKYMTQSDKREHHRELAAKHPYLWDSSEVTGLGR